MFLFLLHPLYWLACIKYLWAVLAFLWDRLSQPGIPACMVAELVWSEQRDLAAEPQAHWTLRAVWIQLAGCSSHCVIGQIMFRDSLSFAPPYVLPEQLGAFGMLKMKRGQQAVGLHPPTPWPFFSSPVVQMSQWYYQGSGWSEGRVHPETLMVALELKMLISFKFSLKKNTKKECWCQLVCIFCNSMRWNKSGDLKDTVVWGRSDYCCSVACCLIGLTKS